MGAIERRYAEALVNLAADTGRIEDFGAQIEALDQSWRDGDVRTLLIDPRVRRDIRRAAVDKLATLGVSPEVISFVKLLIDKDRIALFSGIVSEYRLLAEARRRVLRMKVVSAFPLEEADIRKIKDKFQKLYQASTVDAETVVDPSLIGGVQVIIGDRVVDGSVAAKLAALRKHIQAG